LIQNMDLSFACQDGVRAMAKRTADKEPIP
jgi:hypothetical protein